MIVIGIVLVVGLIGVMIYEMDNSNKRHEIKMVQLQQADPTTE